MINIAICDDDINFIGYIEEIIKEIRIRHENIVFYEYLSGKELIADFDENIEYDLLILDVQMKGINGNEVAIKFREHYLNTILVFCSRIYKTTPSVFKVAPFRYLLKQYTREKMKMEMGEIIDEMEQRKQKPYVVGTYYNNVVKLQPQEIMYASIAKTGSNIYVCPYIPQFEFEKHIKCKKKLPEIYEMLKDFDFTYVHNSYIVNLNYVKKKTMKEIELVNGEILTISRSKEREFRERFIMFLGD